MATWNTRGLRGSTLEELLNRTNEIYLEKGLALIQKIPTPITPLKIDKEHRHITLAYFEQKSTVDYIELQGVPVCFDAKECTSDTFARRISMHQVQFMTDLEKQGEWHFVLFFSMRNELFYLPYRDMMRFWNCEGGRKKELPAMWNWISITIWRAEKRSACPVFRRIAADLSLRDLTIVSFFSYNLVNYFTWW